MDHVVFVWESPRLMKMDVNADIVSRNRGHCGVGRGHGRVKSDGGYHGRRRQFSTVDIVVAETEGQFSRRRIVTR